MQTTSVVQRSTAKNWKSLISPRLAIQVGPLPFFGLWIKSCDSEKRPNAQREKGSKKEPITVLYGASFGKHRKAKGDPKIAPFEMPISKLLITFS